MRGAVLVDAYSVPLARPTASQSVFIVGAGNSTLNGTTKKDATSITRISPVYKTSNYE